MLITNMDDYNSQISGANQSYVPTTTTTIFPPPIPPAYASPEKGKAAPPDPQSVLAASK